MNQETEKYVQAFKEALISNSPFIYESNENSEEYSFTNKEEFEIDGVVHCSFEVKKHPEIGFQLFLGGANTEFQNCKVQIGSNSVTLNFNNQRLSDDPTRGKDGYSILVPLKK